MRVWAAPYPHLWFSKAAARTRRLFCTADFQVCGIAGFQTRWRHRKPAHLILGRSADLEIGDTAGWKPAVRLAQDAGKVRGMGPLFDPHRTNVRWQRAAEPSVAISSGRLRLMRSFALFIFTIRIFLPIVNSQKHTIAFCA
jgi:hypothetical protein